MVCEDKWSEYWNNEGAKGECFVNEKGEKHPELAKFWHNIFEDVSKESNILDVACGAGSIYKDNPKVKEANLFATDLSGNALSQLQAAIPQSMCFLSSASQSAIAPQTINYLVSQFGIEYAGLDAMLAITKCVKPGGKLCFLSHIEDGHIDARNKAELQGVNLCIDTNFVEVAKNATKAAFGSDSAEQQRTLQAFVAIEPLLSQYAEKLKLGVHYHLYWGFRKLFVERHKYHLDDIINWLSGMANELDVASTRLKEMRKAALTKDDVNQYETKLINAEFTNICIKPLVLSGHDLPVAWQISAEKK